MPAAETAGQLLERGNRLFGSGAREAAADCYRQALLIDPALSAASYNLGCTLDALAGPAQALLRDWPDYPPALSLYCASCLLLGRTGEGEAIMTRLFRMGFDCADYLREYATGLTRGTRGDLAAPLRSLAESVSAPSEAAHAGD